jgi:topoisomerase-4 subunit A
MSKGKGNKILDIPAAKRAAGEERMVGAIAVPQGASLVLACGRRRLTLKPADLEHYRGERGRRGRKLPRGFQRVDALALE